MLYTGIATRLSMTVTVAPESTSAHRIVDDEQGLWIEDVLHRSEAYGGH